MTKVPCGESYEPELDSGSNVLRQESKTLSRPVCSARFDIFRPLTMSSSNPGAGRFPTTQWNLVLSASEGSSRESHDALATLCRTYWYPSSNLTPEKIFERQWALTIVDRTLLRLSQESESFDRLKGFLTAD
jgi:hypothetical protein